MAEIIKKQSKISVFWKNQSIFEKEFDVDFFKQFDAIVMALDNIEARVHVSMMSLMAGVVCFEAGTNGLKG